MTDAEWLRSTNPLSMLDFARATASERKMRLFACACVRSVWDVLRDVRGRSAVETAEGFADGLVSAEELELVSFKAGEALAHAQARFRAASTFAETWAAHGLWEVLEAVAYVAGPLTPEPDEWGGVDDPMLGVMEHVQAVARDAIRASGVGEASRWKDGEVTEQQHQADLLRDLFMFRPQNLDPLWVTWGDGTVRRIAQAIYEERAFDRLLILADALEDAGCDNADILAHCRGDGLHVRGCWVVDLLLGKN